MCNFSLTFSNLWWGVSSRQVIKVIQRKGTHQCNQKTFQQGSQKWDSRMSKGVQMMTPQCWLYWWRCSFMLTRGWLFKWDIFMEIKSTRRKEHYYIWLTLWWIYGNVKEWTKWYTNSCCLLKNTLYKEHKNKSMSFISKWNVDSIVL